jgi:predicted phage terminase large subunit-like protein
LVQDKYCAGKFETVFQSWDTANKPTELSDYSVCTTWGVKDKHAYLLNVLRKRLDYPELKRTVREQAEAFSPQTILIEDKASGTQLIQELISEGVHAIKKYEPTMDKIMRTAFCHQHNREWFRSSARQSGMAW